MTELKTGYEHITTLEDLHALIAELSLEVTKLRFGLPSTPIRDCPNPKICNRREIDCGVYPNDQGVCITCGKI